MTSVQDLGLDVHKETISIAVMNSAGKLLMESNKVHSVAGNLGLPRTIRKNNREDRVAHTRLAVFVELVCELRRETARAFRKSINVRNENVAPVRILFWINTPADVQQVSVN